MKLVADLHIHSHYSRATSKDLTFEHLARWAQLKGVQVVGTGDIAHPGWLQEMHDSLVPAEEGLFRLRDDLAAAVQDQVPPACRAEVRFMLAGEISNIYKKGDRTRKIHHVVFAPDLDAVARLQGRLERIGNIRSDGRPILGLPSHDLLEILLEVDERCYLIPAHIWTPWFALLGSMSGYDSMEECFGDLTPQIFAVETGLSSDPPMNWRVSWLDRYTLVSNSDAHSPQKLAREATLFDCEPSYDAIFAALRTGAPATFKGTVEFFPEEGKYHFDGHRKCGVRWHPQATRDHAGICPVCGKPVTVGVYHRVEELADRPEGQLPPRPQPFTSLIPLPELLAEVHGVGAGSKQVQGEYGKLLSRLGPELAILQDLPLEEIKAAGGERLAEGIGRMRRGQVTAEAGYDGEYGVIKVLAGAAPYAPAGQMSLFGEAEDSATKGQAANGKEESLTPDDPAAHAHSAITPHVPSVQVMPPAVAPRSPLPAPPLLDGLNAQQRAAVLCTDAPLIIVAGPGTGKTRTLTVRIAYLIEALQVAPEAILAITFTNKAAREMAERLTGLLGQQTVDRVTVRTFHAFAAGLLREHAGRLGLSAHFVILADEDRRSLLKRARPELKPAEIDQALALISAAKTRLLLPDAPELASKFAELPGLPAIYRGYQDALLAAQSLDFDDLILGSVRLLETRSDVLQTVQERFRWISVDEYQDVNHAQYRLLQLLAAGGANVCVIGDPDQAIYGFRGADRRYFLAFQQDYPGAKSVQLSQNYRSTQVILDAAMQVIAASSDAATQSSAPAAPLQAMQTLAEFVDQIKLDVYHAPTDRAEAEYVVHQIEQMVGGTSYFSLDSGRVEGDAQAVAHSFADFAVLYRLNAQSALLIEAFQRSGIPFQTMGQTPLYAHKAVREVLAYLWLLYNPRSHLHLATMLATVGADTAAGVAETVADPLSRRLQAAAQADGLTAVQRQRLAALAAFWRELEAAHLATEPVPRLIERVRLFLSQQRSEPFGDADLERLGQLARRAQAFAADLPAFLESTVLSGETDEYDPRADRVTLMTLHAAKGLEFPVVFMVGCEEGLLPHERPGKPVDIDEERRLFYVGMTRAQRRLVQTHARKRFLFGQPMENAVSRFVDDIESALKEVREMQRRQAERPDGVQLSLF